MDLTERGRRFQATQGAWKARFNATIALGIGSAAGTTRRSQPERRELAQPG